MYSNGSIGMKNTAAPASAWLFASGWWNAMEDESGSSPGPEKEPPSSSLSRSSLAQSPRQRLNLLLIEDNLPDALLVQEVVRTQELPLCVFTASDGEKAIEFISRAGLDAGTPAPDVVLLDLNLPKIDGWEVLNRIRQSERHKHVLVLVVSSSDSPGDRTRAADLADGYFRKPPDYAEFLKLGEVLKELMQAKGLC